MLQSKTSFQSQDIKKRSTSITRIMVLKHVLEKVSENPKRSKDSASLNTYAIRKVQHIFTSLRTKVWNKCMDRAIFQISWKSIRKVRYVISSLPTKELKKCINGVILPDYPTFSKTGKSSDWFRFKRRTMDTHSEVIEHPFSKRKHQSAQKLLWIWGKSSTLEITKIFQQTCNNAKLIRCSTGISSRTASKCILN